VRRARAMPGPVRPYAMKVGVACAVIFVVRGLGGVVTPVTVEVWMSSWENDRGHVKSGRGFGALVDCTWSHPSRRWSEHHTGVPVAPRFA
jgi:hypothetical protein